MLTTPVGHARLGEHLGEQVGVERRLGCGLDHDGAAGDERGGELERDDELRDVPRHDGRDDADRLAPYGDRAEHAGPLLLGRRSRRARRSSCSTACGCPAWPSWENVIGEPISSVMSSAISACARRRARPAGRRPRRARPDVMRGHGPWSNASRAAATARSMSAGVASGTRPIDLLGVRGDDVDGAGAGGSDPVAADEEPVVLPHAAPPRARRPGHGRNGHDLDACLLGYPHRPAPAVLVQRRGAERGERCQSGITRRVRAMLSVRAVSFRPHAVAAHLRLAPGPVLPPGGPARRPGRVRRPPGRDRARGGRRRGAGLRRRLRPRPAAGRRGRAVRRGAAPARRRKGPGRRDQRQPRLGPPARLRLRPDGRRRASTCAPTRAPSARRCSSPTARRSTASPTSSPRSSAPGGSCPSAATRPR